MQPGFNRPDADAGDARNFFQWKILKEMQQQRRTLGRRQLRQCLHELRCFLLANKQLPRIIHVVGQRRQLLVVGRQLAVALAPMLDAFLVRDAKEPASEPVIVAQSADVTDGAMKVSWTMSKLVASLRTNSKTYAYNGNS